MPDDPLFGEQGEGLARPAGQAVVLYRQASRRIMELLPIVPYTYFHFAVALRKNVTGYVPSPTGPIGESFANVAFSA